MFYCLQQQSAIVSCYSRQINHYSSLYNYYMGGIFYTLFKKDYFQGHRGSSPNISCLSHIIQRRVNRMRTDGAILHSFLSTGLHNFS